ncbi:MAG: methyltransferase domain-containing protein [Oligoflexales bacterium]|nr:methyltransferase domain-containing protein [Oligoflexales bacterium]
MSLETKRKCRVCGNDFMEPPLLVQKDMPSSAQYLPRSEDLSNDRGIDIEVCQCSGCGLVQLDNDEVPYYREVIRATEISSEVREFRRKSFKEILDKHDLIGKRVCEIGCGRGGFLSVVSEFDVDARGIEFSDENVAACRKNGLKVEKGFLSHPSDRIPGWPFDLIMILNFLEHFPDPNCALRAMYHNLSADGILHVEVPNFNMIIRDSLFSEFIPDHLLYFTKETLTHILNQNGFEAVEYREERYDYVISVIARKRKAVAISRFEQHQSKLKNEIHGFIDGFAKDKVAIWGAGHQALSVISLLELKNKIKYVVDSASFKQDRYTPASHIKITSPDAIVSDPVDAIIVMAAAYSDEVVKIIKTRYENLKVAILRNRGLEIL